MATLERIDEQLKRFDEYWLNHHRKGVVEAVYRENIGTLEHRVREKQTYIECLERVLNAESIKWHNHPAWAQPTTQQPKDT